MAAAGTYLDYLRSPRWQWLRAQALSRDGYACRVCSSGVRLEVHHRRYPVILGDERTEDLTTLCHRCHNLFSVKRRIGWRMIVGLVIAENLSLLWLVFRWLN